MDDSYKLKKLTNCRWANLFEVRLKRKAQAERSWVMCSRKDQPIEKADEADAVVIVATIDVAGEKKLVVTKEFRVPIWDDEYGFPAGLIDEGEDIEGNANQSAQRIRALCRRRLDKFLGLACIAVERCAHQAHGGVRQRPHLVARQYPGCDLEDEDQPRNDAQRNPPFGEGPPRVRIALSDVQSDPGILPVR